MNPEQKLSTYQVLRNKFPENEYVLICEVSDASGFDRNRSLDYMLVNLWNSRGLAITGIERKSNRGDWLKEMKNPKKQENHFKHCDYFYLLTDKNDVAKIEEIPETWGWMHINEKQMLKTIKAAPKLQPLPIGRSLLCAMLRRASDKEKFVHVDSVETYIQERAEKIKSERNFTMERKAKDYDDLFDKVTEFEKASGVNIRYTGWHQKCSDIGKAVSVIVNGGVDSYLNNIERMAEEIKSLYERIQKDATELNKLKTAQEIKAA